MRFNARTMAIALQFLLTAHSAQAGPIMWTGRIYRRSTPVDGQYTTSAAPTAAHDDSQTDSGGSGTTPRPIFETLSTTLAYPIPGTSETSGTPQSTVEAPVVDSTTEAQTKAPSTSVEQSSAMPSSAYPVDTTGFAESSTLTSAIAPEQPTATPTYTNTPGQTKESTTAVEKETSAVQVTSGGTSAATTGVVITTSIVPKQPSSGTDVSSAYGTPTSAAGAVESTSPAQATQSIITTSIVPQQPTTTPSTQYQTPGGSSVVTTVTSDQAAAPAETSTAGDYQSTPSDTTTRPDQDKHYPTSGHLQSSVDLGGLQPSGTSAAASTPVQETSAVVPPTSADNAQPTSGAATSGPGTTLTISVGNPDGTVAASSTDAQASSTDVQATSTGVQATQTYAAPSEPTSSPTTQAPSSTGVSSSPSGVSSTEAAGSSAAASSVVPTGTPNTAVPVASILPTFTAVIDANEYAENLSQARKLNQVYSGLTADSACSSGQAACIDGKFAQCNSAGSYTLTDCGTNEKCFAFPATTVKGVTLSCQSLDKAKEILGTTGNDSSATTSAAEQPAASTTATTEAAVTTTEAKTEPNYPVVTVTQIVTVDDGASSTTSEPAQQQTSEPAQSSEATSSPDVSTSEPSRPHTLITVTRTRSSTPETSSPAQGTATYDAPAATATSATEPTVIVVTKTRPATSEASSSPVEAPTTTTDAAATTSLPAGSSTVTESIKNPGGYPDSGATSQGGSGAEPTQATTVLLIPIEDDSSKTTPPAAAATEAAVDGFGSTTTTTVDGTPTVSVYFTVTVTQKDHETVTVTQHEKETVTVVISA